MARCILSLTAHMYGLKRATERGDWGLEQRLVWDMGDRRFRESEILLDGGTRRIVMVGLWHYYWIKTVAHRSSGNL
jgi:hypothetical protein